MEEEVGMIRVRSVRPGRVMCAVVMLMTGSMWLTPDARAADLPGRDGKVHNGVLSCAGSHCHGNEAPRQGGVVGRDEHAIWRDYDVHNQAYKVLKNDVSKRIAANLGLGKPAHESDQCLDCHADNVPVDLRGSKFKLSDGVGCEACHGGSENWYTSHDAGPGHQANLDNGMYPTDDPVARARLCISCHYGDEAKFVNHRLMGAGHPRMSFELAIFTESQPRHFTVDADYTDRGKQAPQGAQVWAIGQAVEVERVLDALLDPDRGRDGIWPEFVLFDCDACHHPMSEGRWRARPSTGLGPGMARLNDSSFLMLRHALVGVSPNKAKALALELRALHVATGAGSAASKKATLALRARALDAIGVLREWQPDVASIRRVLKSLVDEGLAGEYLDYAGAEQAMLAVQVLAFNLYTLDAIEEDAIGQVGEIAQGLTAALENPETYDRSVVVNSFRKVKAATNP
jgi:hypothetical protein